LFKFLYLKWGVIIKIGYYYEQKVKKIVGKGGIWCLENFLVHILL